MGRWRLTTPPVAADCKPVSDITHPAPLTELWYSVKRLHSGTGLLQGDEEITAGDHPPVDQRGNLDAMLSARRLGPAASGSVEMPSDHTSDTVWRAVSHSAAGKRWTR